MITVTATYEEFWWPELCDTCGSEVDWRPWDTPGGEYREASWECPTCGDIPESGHTPADDPSELRGWCDPANPFGGFRDDDMPIEHRVDLAELVELVAEFPGGVWGWRDDGDAEQDIRTGHYTRVTLHIPDSVSVPLFRLLEMSE